MNAAHAAEALKTEIDSLKARKGELSRLIGEARKQNNPADDLIAEMKAVSASFKQLSKQYKDSLKKDQAATPQNGEKIDIDSVIAALTSTTPILKRETQFERIEQDVRNPKQVKAWDDYLDVHPQASPYHRTAVRQFVESAYGHKTNYLCAMDVDDKIIGVLPLIQLNSKLFGNFIVSAPYFNYGGLLADNEPTAQKLVAAAKAWVNELGSSHAELRHLQDSALKLPQRTEKMTFWLPLPNSEEQLWNGFKTKLRAQIKRPQRENPIFKIGGGELLEDFYSVFARNMRDLGTPVYGKPFFSHFLKAFGKAATVVVCYLNEKPVAAAILVGYKERMEIPWASTVREANPIGINMFMYWEVLKYAVAGNYKIFDFGRCTEDSGTYRFKQQWGAKPIRMHWDYCLSAGSEAPKLNPDNPKFKLLIAIWRKLPVWLTKLIGPPVVKYLP